MPGGLLSAAEPHGVAPVSSPERGLGLLTVPDHPPPPARGRPHHVQDLAVDLLGLVLLLLLLARLGLSLQVLPSPLPQLVPLTLLRDVLGDLGHRRPVFDDLLQSLGRGHEVFVPPDLAVASPATSLGQISTIRRKSGPDLYLSAFLHTSLSDGFTRSTS